MHAETTSPQAQPPGESGEKELTRIERALFWILLAAGAAFGLFQAWLYRQSTHPDYGITLLMARHIAAGRDFPVFFYGQAYLGSIESYLAALLCLVFGTSSFVIACGHAACALLIVLVAWAWAKDAAGPRAGLAAMLFCVFYYPNPFIKHGGYAMTVVCSALTLWLTCRALVREQRGTPVGARDFFIIGLVAGLGWWTDQLVIASLVTSALLIVIVLRFRALMPRVSVTGIAGFFLGGLPFWIWNARHQWATWNFENSFGRTSMLTGLHIFFQYLYADAVGLGGLPSAIQSTIVIFAFVMMIALFFRGLKMQAGWIHPLAWILFVTISALIASRTHFIATHVTRYLSPQLPVVAVVVGCAMATIRPRAIGAVLWIIPALAAWSSLSAVPWPFSAAQPVTKPPYFSDFSQTVDVLLSNHVHHAYVEQFGAALNFYGNERVELSSELHQYPIDRYLPYTQDAERDIHPGFIGDYGGIENFIAYAGGSAKKTVLTNEFKSFLHDLVPPSAGIAEIPAEAVRSITSMDGRDVKNTVMDRTVASLWTAQNNAPKKDFIEIAFTAPTNICGLRMLSTGSENYPHEWRLDRWDDSANRWLPILEKAVLSPCYWSGPRPYWGLFHHHVTMRFAPCLTSRLRVTPLDQTRFPWQIAEMQFFAPAPEPPPAPAAMPALLQKLGEYGVTRLYSDRWEANEIHGRNKKITTDLDPEVSGRRKSMPILMRFRPVTAVLVSRENAPATRDAFRIKTITARETEIGPWILFDFPEADYKPSYADNTGLFWTGYACLVEH